MDQGIVSYKKNYVSCLDVNSDAVETDFHFKILSNKMDYLSEKFNKLILPLCVQLGKRWKLVGNYGKGSGTGAEKMVKSYCS